jgi:predicted membrane channel-forming protein YqfA (hemolysin III family)
VAWLSILAPVTLAGVMIFVPRIPQPQWYHDFADQRALIRGVPNSFDVLSNLPFIGIGVAGLVITPGAAFISSFERTDAIVFFIGTILTAIGSLIYHLRPNDTTLVYDRLGIVIAFMSFLAMLAHESIDGAAWLLPALLLIGVAGVAWWRAFDDLRPYGWAQFFPLVVIVALLFAERPRYSGQTAAMIVIAGSYTAAKLFELWDRRIYHALRQTISGHTLKHLSAACGVLTTVIWIAARTRR